MAYQLSITVFGLGEDPNHRSHWGFTLHQPSTGIIDLLHVRLIDLDKLWYQFEPRLGTNLADLATMQAMGMCRLAQLNHQQRQQVIQVIGNEPAPRDGSRRCQDWVFSTLIALEVEELVPPGTSEFWKGMVGRPAAEVKRAVGGDWIEFGCL